jgi:predicted O-methyltransferase YrrM
MLNWLLIALLITFVFMLSILFPFPLLGAPFDFSREEAIKNIVRLTNPKGKDRIAELGSGDGRVCIAIARENPMVKVYGFEINPILVILSRIKIKKAGLEDRIEIKWKNFWTVDLGRFNKIVFFQFDNVMKRIEKKLESELKKGSVVVSHHWKLPNWRISGELGEEHISYGKVYLYKR